MAQVIAGSAIKLEVDGVPLTPSRRHLDHPLEDVNVEVPLEVSDEARARFYTTFYELEKRHERDRKAVWRFRAAWYDWPFLRRSRYSLVITLNGVRA